MHLPQAVQAFWNQPACGYGELRQNIRTFAADVLHQCVDMGEGDLVRTICEMPLGNRRLFLVDNPWMFVSNSDFNRCWLVPEMRHATYTIEVTLEAFPWLFGGHVIQSCLY
jgi:hypothetical protein